MDPFWTYTIHSSSVVQLPRSHHLWSRSRYVREHAGRASIRRRVPRIGAGLVNVQQVDGDTPGLTAGSRFGIFTYIHLFFMFKCRSIYHTFNIWGDDLGE